MYLILNKINLPQDHWTLVSVHPLVLIQITRNSLKSQKNINYVYLSNSLNHYLSLCISLCISMYLNKALEPQEYSWLAWFNISSLVGWLYRENLVILLNLLCMFIVYDINVFSLCLCVMYLSKYPWSIIIVKYLLHPLIILNWIKISVDILVPGNIHKYLFIL